jgi:hypothetical protein
MRSVQIMVQAPPRDALQVLDWLVSRYVHEYLDVAGRPVGEGRSAAFEHVQTEMQSCPYAGSRYHHAKPMNVSALRQIVPIWEDIVTMLAWLSQRYRRRNRKELATFEDLALVTSAGVFLTDFLALRERTPLGSGDFPVLISGLYKVCLGFQLAAFLGSMQERFAPEAAPSGLPNAEVFYAYLEDHELLIGEAEVCSGPPAMIMQAYDAMLGNRPVAAEALPPDCRRLEIAWDQFDVFTHHAANLWNDLVMYVVQSARFIPELADPRLPADVQARLNSHLKVRGAELLAGQVGQVVNIARSVQSYFGCLDHDGLSESAEPMVPSPIHPQGGVAATVVSWLHKVAEADMQTYGQVVASILEHQLAPYEAHEAAVLSRLNQQMNCLMPALGFNRPSTALTPSALSQVCGRTLRDWGAAS